MKPKNRLNISDSKVNSRRKWAEPLASVGMVLIAVGMFLPLLNLMSTERLPLFKWVFSAGALCYWAARCVDLSPTGESLRLRRLRRMEFWAGACFGVAAFFWFWNEKKYAADIYTGPLTILKDTIMFALAGAVLQLVSAWMIYFRQRKEAKANAESKQK